MNGDFNSIVDKERKDLVIKSISEILTELTIAVNHNESLCFYCPDWYLTQEECYFIQDFLRDNVDFRDVTYAETTKETEEGEKICCVFVFSLYTYEEI